MIASPRKPSSCGRYPLDGLLADLGGATDFNTRAAEQNAKVQPSRSCMLANEHSRVRGNFFTTLFQLEPVACQLRFRSVGNPQHIFSVRRGLLRQVCHRKSRAS